VNGREFALEEIAVAMKEQGFTADECVERFAAANFRSELISLETLIQARQAIPAAKAGARKEAFLRSVRREPALSLLPLGGRLRGAIAAIAVLVGGTAVAAAADPIGVAQDIGRGIGIVGEGTDDRSAFEVEAVVIRVDAERDVLTVDAAGEGMLEIRVSDDTILVGVTRLAQIRAGATVLISGSIVDGRYEAGRIEVLGTEREAEEPVDRTPTPEAAPETEPPPATGEQPAPDGGAPGSSPSSPGGGAPVLPGPEATPTPPPSVPLLPELPLEPPLLPDDPLPGLPLPELPLPELPLPPLPPLLP
jgi:hypothetical protein